MFIRTQRDFCHNFRVADDSPRTSSLVSDNSVCAAESESIGGGWQLDRHRLLLNLHSGVGSELLLAFDAGVTYRFEFSRVSDFVE